MRHQRARGALVVPVSGDGLVPLGGLGALLGDVAGPVHAGFAGEQPYLGRVVAQPAARDVAGVVAVVPVPVPVMRDPEGGGLVVALAELCQQLRVRGTGPGLGPFCQAMGFAEDLDDVCGPGLQAVRPQLVTARQRLMTCWLCRYRHNQHLGYAVNRSGNWSCISAVRQGRCAAGRSRVGG